MSSVLYLLRERRENTKIILRNTRFSFYKNILYKNIEDEMGQKVKNILRICSSWTYKVKNTLCKNIHPNGIAKKQKPY